MDDPATSRPNSGSQRLAENPMWQANMTKIGDTNEFAEPYEVIFRIQRGLTGLISYLAAAESNTIFNEALLYEPTLRIFAAKKYGAECEVVCQGVEQPA